MEGFEKFQCGCRCYCGYGCGCKQNSQILLPVAHYQPHQAIIQSDVGNENHNFNSEIDLQEINNQINLQFYNELIRQNNNRNNMITTINEWSNETININTNSTNSTASNNYNSNPTINKRKNHYKNNLKNHYPYNNIRATNINKKQFIFNVYCLSHGNLSPKIPRKTAKLRRAGLIKELTCSDDDLYDGIKKTIEDLFPCLKGKNWKFFRCKTTSDLEVAKEPKTGWNTSALKSIAGTRKKLYLGTVN
ncbi:hypothetical protein GLOIN_2v1817357 [Rhizophagus clarus]|uniref:Uncharacterized protein n=1 Tax=Rhizophagus clarus TaxID=94130 RepID=A0A8H3LEY0_9GLOM|nr:hypothetical protein GLOIN_2v1817357 [Rhizophagus clarus]